MNASTTRTGRLRLRFTQLKHDPERLHAVAGALRAVPGVLSVSASPFSGAFLIHYQAAGATAHAFQSAIAAALAQHRLSHDRHRPSRPLRRAIGGHTAAQHDPGAAIALGRQVARGIAGAVVGKLAERSAMALLAACL